MLPVFAPMALFCEESPMRNARRRRPSLEALEDRRLPAIYGIPWPDPGHLTVSFVPDGTNVGGAPSRLVSAFNSEMPPSQWQNDILRGLQDWAALGNINIGVVPDDGRPLGAPGPLQGAPGVGDIRIAARPLSHNMLAEAAPFDLLGPWSGAIIFNSDASFGDGPSAPENLFTAAVHEAGHVFGFADEHSDQSSVMYDVDTGPSAGLSAHDAAMLQALYGARQPNTSSGSTFATAVPVAVEDGDGSANSASSSNHLPAVVNADVTTLKDQEFYSFKIPADWSGPVAVVVRTEGVSLLTPKLTVYDADGEVVGAAVSTNPLDNNVTVTVTSPIPGATYYAKVNSSQANAFGIGAYVLAAGKAAWADAETLTPAPLTFGPANGHPNDRFQNATHLDPTTPGTDARWVDTITAGIFHPSDVNYYRVATGMKAPGATLLTVYGLQSGSLTPRVSVFDASHNPLPEQVLYSDAGSESVQVLGAAANSILYVAVSAADPSGSHATGDYFLGVTSRATPISDPTFATGTLKASKPVDFRTLKVDSTRVFHFDLSGSVVTPSSSPSAVLMTVYDAAGTPVFNLRAVAGAGASQGDVLLDPGTYIVRIVAATKSGEALPAFAYTLGGQLRTDPDGPNPQDSTFDPSSPNPSGPPDDPGTWSTQDTAYYTSVLSPSQVNGSPW